MSQIAITGIILFLAFGSLFISTSVAKRQQGPLESIQSFDLNVRIHHPGAIGDTLLVAVKDEVGGEFAELDVTVTDEKFMTVFFDDLPLVMNQTFLACVTPQDVGSNFFACKNGEVTDLHHSQNLDFNMEKNIRNDNDNTQQQIDN